MEFSAKPLRERVKFLKDEDWEEIEMVARAMYMQNEMDMMQAEAYAMLGHIEAREHGIKQRAN